MELRHYLLQRTGRSPKGELRGGHRQGSVIAMTGVSRRLLYLVVQARSDELKPSQAGGTWGAVGMGCMVCQVTTTGLRIGRGQEGLWVMGLASPT